jgi:hypothetical protein
MNFDVRYRSTLAGAMGLSFAVARTSSGVCTAGTARPSSVRMHSVGHQVDETRKPWVSSGGASELDVLPQNSASWS